MPQKYLVVSKQCTHKVQSLVPKYFAFSIWCGKPSNPTLASHRLITIFRMTCSSCFWARTWPIPQDPGLICLEASSRKPGTCETVNHWSITGVFNSPSVISWFCLVWVENCSLQCWTAKKFLRQGVSLFSISMLFQCLFAGFPRDDPNQLGCSFSLPLRIVWWRGLQIEGRKSKPCKSAALESKRVLKKKFHAISLGMFFWCLNIVARKLFAGSRSPSWGFPDWRAWRLPTASLDSHSTDGSLICVSYCNGDAMWYSRTENILKLLGLIKHWKWGILVDQESVAGRSLFVLESICLLSSWS